MLVYVSVVSSYHFVASQILGHHFKHHVQHLIPNTDQVQSILNIYKPMPTFNPQVKHLSTE